MQHAKKGDKVKVHYTGKLDDGTVFDSSKERDEPLEFEVGTEKIIPGFNDAVEGMEVSEEKTITIPSDQAYGEPHKELVQEVELSQFPENMTPQVGMMVELVSDNGQRIPFQIKEIKEKTAILDGNHPLAGKDLTFELQLVEIQ